MKKTMIGTLSSVAIAAMLTLPSMAFAAEEKAPAPVPPKPSNVKLETAGAFTALQIGKQVYTFNDKEQIFQTMGAEQTGSLQDLFVLPYGPEQVPFIAVDNAKNGLMVFSDLWPKLAKDRASDKVEAYDAGRIFYTAQTKIVSKTSHHYAEQTGKEVVVYTANDFDDLKKGYHESIRVTGKLRGLILYDCCPYVVVENDKKELNVYHAGEKGAVQVGTIEL